MNDESLMPWGKFKGEKLANVPAKYLIWCLSQEYCKGELKQYIEENKTVLLTEIYRESPNNEESLQKFIDRNSIPEWIK